jgi:hypothetical protein
VSRPLLSLWPYLCRALVPLGLFAALVVLVPLVVLGVLPLRSLLAGAGTGILCVVLSRNLCWLWRFALAVRRFRTVREGSVVLHFAPELADKWHLPILLQRCREELDRLTDWFGFPLRGRAVIFLFEHSRDVGRIFGSAYGGCALPQANAIVIPNDGNIQAMMRHEFAHLFAAYWSEQVPPLLGEGLPVWLQRSEQDQPINAVARHLLADPNFKLALLLQPGFFFAEPQRRACYLLAGSFTGFLIRRFGLQRYGALFRQCTAYRFGRKFEKCFGMTLEQAERSWRQALLGAELCR